MFSPAVHFNLQSIRCSCERLRSRVNLPSIRKRSTACKSHAKPCLRVRPAVRDVRKIPLRPYFARTFTCHVIIVNLLIWPDPSLTVKPIIEPASAMVGSAVSSAISQLRGLPVMMFPLELSTPGPLVIPVPVLPFWPFQASSVARPNSIAERTARVAEIKVTPQRLVAYIGDTVTFVAMGSGLNGQPEHGAKFQWGSSDTNKLTIDEAGCATMLQPGMVSVTATAGAALVLTPDKPPSRRNP